MLKIGITGGIGSGKSTAAKIFSIFNIPVFQADTIAKEIMNSDIQVKLAITEIFGKDAYSNGHLNRSFLAEKIFMNNYLLEQLNAIVHPAVNSEAAIWFRKQNTPYALKEAAIMFESGSVRDLDFVIGVYAPKNLRLKRVLNRESSLKKEDVVKRMNNQINEEIKMKLCDFVIVNDEQQLLIPQVLHLHQHFSHLAYTK